MILDGTLPPIDRIAADQPYYSGKHTCHGMNVQVIADPRGRLLWASPALPGAVHDIKAARTHGIIDTLTKAGARVGGQGISRGERHAHRALPRPLERPSGGETLRQPRSRQDPSRRRTSQRHPQSLAPAALLHDSYHESRQGGPRPSPRDITLSLEKAQ